MNLLAHSVLFFPSQNLAFFQSVLDDGFNFSLRFLDIGETGLDALIFTVIEMHMLKQLVLRLQNRGLLLAIVLVIFNFIFQEFWDAMPRPGWSPWWVQRRPQTIPGPTFEPLAERPATGPRPPRSPDKVRDLDGGTSAKGDLGASVVPAGARTVCNRKPALPVGERGASGALFLRRLCPWATPSIGSQKLSKIDER